MAQDPHLQSLSSILASIQLEANPPGRISILKRPTGALASNPTTTNAAGPSPTASITKASTASFATDQNSNPSKASSQSTSASAAASSSPSPTTTTATAAATSNATSAQSQSASAEGATGGSRSTIDPESNQNRRRKDMLKMEMEWRKQCERSGGDYTSNTDWGLMEAEWLRSIPEDFERKWLVVPCPVGKRCSLWALDGETHAYTKQGFFMESFECALPNGFHYSGAEGSTFLDAVYVENLSTYFVLDALQWDDYDLRRGSAEFRLFQLNSKFAEYVDSGDVHPRSRSRFQNFVMQLPILPCTPSGVMKALTWSPLPNLKMDLDGVLFYHHDAMYRSGSTPLVAWIKPWMAEEVFSNVKIPPHLLARKPNHYKNRQTFMKEWDDKEARKRAKGTEKVGRKQFMRQSDLALPSNPSSLQPGSQGTTTTTRDDDDDDDGVKENQSRAPLNDDPALAEVAKEAQTSDNSLLALVGENILDTFGLPASLPPANYDQTSRIGQWTANQ